MNLLLQLKFHIFFPWIFFVQNDDPVNSKLHKIFLSIFFVQNDDPITKLHNFFLWIFFAQNDDQVNFSNLNPNTKQSTKGLN